MRVRLLTLRLDPGTGCFDEQALVQLCQDERVVSVTEHWFDHDGLPGIAFVLRCRDLEPLAGQAPVASPPAIEVAEPDAPLFQALRKWRNERARREGRPAYVIFNNSQLAALASQRPTTRTEMAAIQGVGEARVRDYADDVLALVQSHGG